MSLAASAAAKPVAANAVAGALDDVNDESKLSEGLIKPKSTMVSSFEEYLQNRGYEPWRSKFVYGWSPVSNKHHYSACAPAFCYKGNNKPNAQKVAAAQRGTIIEKTVQVTIEGETKDIKVKSIQLPNGQFVQRGDYCWANPNREVDEQSGKAMDYLKPSESRDPLERDTAELQMTLFEVVSDETVNKETQIKEVEYCIRGGIFAPLKWEFRTQEHVYNWGVGSTMEDFFKILTCLFTLWGVVGLLYYLLLTAALETSDTFTTLWIFFGMMFTGWTFIGISLGAQKITEAREKAAAKENEGSA